MSVCAFYSDLCYTMHNILKFNARHKSLYWNNLGAVRREKYSTCRYHSVTNVTYTSEFNITTLDLLKRQLICNGLSSKAVNCNLHNTYNRKYGLATGVRALCTQGQTQLNVNQYMECSDENTRLELKDDMLITYDFISEEEENQLMNEVEPYLKRLRYESSHWDDAIHGYREIERKTWTEKNKAIIQRIRDVAFPAGTPQLAHVHVLDLKKDGYIKPHVDAVKFCGNTVAGICLMSPAIMRLAHTEDKTKYADFLLERRCLYIMKDVARYDYTHEVLREEDSTFKGRKIPKDRRISVMCRNEPRV